MNWPKKLIRKVLFAAVFLVLAFGTMVAHANMKSTGGITWDLKTKKTLTYYSYWGGVGMIPQNVKMTNFKDRKVGNSGKRRVSFTLTFIRKRRPTAQELINASTYYNVQHPELDNTSPRCYFTVVDYVDGISLEDPKNPYGVTVTHGNWITSSPTTYKTGGYSIAMTNTKVKVTITYPASYKNLCIGVGGMNRVSSTGNDKLFWDGIYPFWMTDSFTSSQYKKISHFGRWWY